VMWFIVLFSVSFIVRVVWCVCVCLLCVYVVLFFAILRVVCVCVFL